MCNLYSCTVKPALGTLQLLFIAVTVSAQAPIISEEVTFRNGPITLSGTVFRPKETGVRHPGIAITHGSGKDGKKHPGFISLAGLLAGQGFVVLIYDKRGVGESGGTYSESPDLNVPAGDLVAAVDYLSSLPGVDQNRIGVYGHSQGGWVAPLAAVISQKISFVIAACGGGIPVREQNLFAEKNSLLNKGYSLTTVNEILDFADILYNYLATGKGYKFVNAQYERAAREQWFAYFEQMGFGKQLPPPGMLSAPHFNFFKFTQFDPQANIRSLDVPTLVLLAEKDESVPFQSCKQAWENGFEASGKRSLLTIVTLSGEDHYDFIRSNAGVIYKSTFGIPLTDWLKRKVIP